MGNAPAYFPRLSVFDPAEASEGSLDPLGLAQLATSLGEGLVPGFTERSRRPRFLTALAFGARLLDRPRYSDGVYGDHPQGPANIAFERLLVESFARRGESGEAGLLGVPGIGKARDAMENDVRLTSQVYLVAPGAVGLWVAYKRLARELNLLDENGHLLENGFELLRAWEDGTGQRGLVTGHGEASRELFDDLDRALEPLLDSKIETQRPRQAWEFLYEQLKPHALTRPEANVLRRLVIAGDESRADVFGTIAGHGGEMSALLDEPEHRVLAVLHAHGSSRTRSQVDAILAYERVVVLSLAAFDAMRFAGSARPDGRIDADFVLSREDGGRHLRDAPKLLRAALATAGSRIDDLGHIAERRAATEWLDDAALESPHALFDALMRRHFETQRRKPPDGKRPWIEGDSSGFFVRTRYVPDEPPRERETFHPYRTTPVRTMLRDFQGAER